MGLACLEQSCTCGSDTTALSQWYVREYGSRDCSEEDVTPRDTTAKGNSNRYALDFGKAKKKTRFDQRFHVYRCYAVCS